MKRLEGNDERERGFQDTFSIVGSNMLKRWQELAKPSLTSCLQSIPGVYTRAEILHEVNEENEEEMLTPQNDFEGQSSSSSFPLVHCIIYLDRLSISLDKHSPETPVYSK